MAPDDAPTLDAGTQARLLRRIGLAHRPAADAAGLRIVHRAFVSHVPFEDLAVQLGESETLNPRALVERVLHGGRGGYCFEVNTVLFALLESLGFAVERRQAIVGSRSDAALGAPTNHMALVVVTSDEGEFIAEAGWGEGPLDPLPLKEGPVTSGEFERVLERDGDGWWVSQHRFGSTPGFRFGDVPATLADFGPYHSRLSTAPESLFVSTLVVARVFDDRIASLRARTLFVDGPGVHERRLIEDEQEFAAVMYERFGIDPDTLGPDRLARLWQQASDQHDQHQRSVTA